MRMPLVVVVGVVALVLAIVVGFEPVQGDGWANYFNARAPLTWEHVVALARHDHELNNPRWGQLVLALSYHHAAVAIVLTPLVITGMLLLAIALVRGRAPRLRDPDDAWLFVCLFAAAAITTPKVGVVWFYRPSCTNYIYPLAVQLAWLVPYRAWLDGRRPSSITALVLGPLGFLAGAGNEHTGPALAIAALACIAIAWRRERRVPLWSIIGLVALVAGTVFLLTAPGQQVRYESLAARRSWIAPLVARGVLGTLSILRTQLLWASPMLLVLLVAARTARWPTLTAKTRRLALGCLGVAAIMIGTSLLSPMLPTRLLAAPAMFIVLAMGLVLVELVRDARAARILRRSCAAIAIAVLAYALVIHIVTGVEGRRRLAILESAPRGSIVDVASYTFRMPRLVSFGDDFRSAKLRRHIAERLGLAEIRWR